MKFKFNNIRLFFGASIVALGMVSCELNDLDINVDPNSASQASLELLLTNAQFEGLNTFGGGLNNSTMGFQAINTSSDNFNFTNSSWNGTWNYLYSGPLKDLEEMINAADAAVEMINYQNTSNLKSFSLFGFKFRDYLALGTQVFRKNSFGTYDLVFLQESRGKLASIERPLKLIEKRKTGSWKRKQNEVSFEFSIRLSNIETKEYMLIDKSPISKSEYENFKPIFKVDKVRLDAFDPHFWDGYSILEPNDILREFKIQ